MTQTPSGNDLIVTIPIVASNLMLGTYNIFLSPAGSWNFAQPNGYWQPIAQSAWPAPPTTSVFPGSGTGMNATFDVTLSSSGVGKSRALSKSLFIINQYASGVGACYAIYTNTNHKLIMLADSGNSIVSNGSVFLGTTPGPSQIASNSQCTMDLGQITYADPGTNDVSLHIPVQSFSTLFSNTGPQTKQVYSVPIDRAGQVPTTWPSTSNGTWLVAPAPPPIPPADFTISAAPVGSTTTVARSNLQVNYTVNVTPVNGFSGTVNLAATGLPGGATATFSPAFITGSGSAMMTIHPDNTNIAGNFDLFVTGQSGQISHSSAKQQISFQDFTYTISPTTQAVAPGGTAIYTAMATGLNGYSLPVIFHMVPCLQPPPAFAAAQDISLTLGQPKQISVPLLDSAAPLFPRCLNVTFASTYSSKTATMFVDTGSASSFTLGVSAAQSISSPGTAIYTLSTVASGGFNGSVGLSMTGLPAGVTASSLPSLPSTGSATWTLSARQGVIPGTYPITIAGVGGSITRTVFAILTIQGPADFTISANPSTVNGTPSSVASMNILVTGSQGFSGQVTVTPSGFPSNTTVSPSSAIVTGTGIASFLITTTNSANGNFPINIMAANGSNSRRTTVMLSLGAAAPATMIAPSPGAFLTGSSANFTWTPGAGASQYQLLLGSSAGASNFYSGNPTSAQSAIASLPAVGTTVVATLRSLIGGGWQPQSYTYQVVEPLFGAKVAPLSATTEVRSVPNNNEETRTGPYYAVKGINPTIFISASNVTSCDLKTEEGGTIPGKLLRPSMWASSGNSNSSFDVSFSVPNSVTSGLKDMTCQIGVDQYTAPLVVNVYDASPIITEVIQYPSEVEGGPFWITIHGTNLGKSGTVSVCPTGANPCNTSSQDFTKTSYDDVDSSWTQPPTGQGEINVLLYPTPNTNGLFDVQVNSKGASGLAFGFGGGQNTATAAGSNKLPGVQLTKVLEISWASANNQPLWRSFNFASNGDSLIGPVFWRHASIGTAVNEPSALIAGTNARMENVLIRLPGASGSGIVRITVSPADFTIPDTAVSFVGGQAIQAGQSRISINTGTLPQAIGKGQAYTFTWSLRLGVGPMLKFQETTHKIYRLPTALPTVNQFNPTEIRVDRVTTDANGCTSTSKSCIVTNVITGLLNKPTFNSLEHIHSEDLSNPWAVLDYIPNLGMDCESLSLLGAVQLRMLGLLTADTNKAYPTGAFPLPGDTDATSQETMTTNGVLYNLVFAGSNKFEGYINLGPPDSPTSGAVAYTVAPRSTSSISPTVCNVSPSSIENRLSFAVLIDVYTGLRIDLDPFKLGQVWFALASGATLDEVVFLPKVCP